MYILTFRTYKPKMVLTEGFHDWLDALQAAEEIVENYKGDLTRHSSWQGLVRHMDTYFDLYNEIAISIKPGHVSDEKAQISNWLVEKQFNKG